MSKYYLGILATFLLIGCGVRSENFAPSLGASAAKSDQGAGGCSLERRASHVFFELRDPDLSKEFKDKYMAAYNEQCTYLNRNR